ncbi:hypothetical protein [Streptomyces phaeochromogenes]
MGLDRDGARDFAYYADDWIWPGTRTDLMKSTLLFFDGLALSLPQSIADRLIDSSPVLAQPLAERGLLINLEPETHLQADTAYLLARGLHEVLGRFPPAGQLSVQRARATIGSFHWGGVRAHLESNVLSRMMLARGYAELDAEPHSEGEPLFRVDPAVRLLILNAYCQALRTDLQQQSDITLQPVAQTWDHSRREWYHSMQFLQWAAARVTPGTGFAAAEIMATDLHTLGVNVSAAPLDEILGFRAEYRSELRAYTAGLRTFLENTAGLSDQQYESEKRARIERLNEEAAALKSTTRRAFGRMGIATGLGIAGAVWTGTHGDLMGALLAGAAAAAAVTRPAQPVTAYTYILHAGHAFS